jgi:hypothetical protein
LILKFSRPKKNNWLKKRKRSWQTKNRNRQLRRKRRRKRRKSKKLKSQRRQKKPKILKLIQNNDKSIFYFIFVKAVKT